ncbi:hypothetical protein HK405_002477, partial [Cladochytrium tenue]
MIYCDPNDAANPCSAGTLPPPLTPYVSAARPNDPRTEHRLTVRSVKLVTDGALGSWGAALIEPYEDRPDTTGLLRIPRDRVDGLIWDTMRQGYQVNVHCIGDLANKLVLDGFERAAERRTTDGTLPPANLLRSRIEHSQIVRKEDVARFVQLGIIPSVQPTH